jgi:hypothetical protein
MHVENKIHGSWLQYVDLKSCSLEIHWTKNCSRKINHGDGGAIVKDLISQRGGEEFNSPHLQPKLFWLLRWPN